MFENPADFFEAHPDPMLVIDDLTNRILNSNKAAEKLFGYSKTDFQSIEAGQIGLYLIINEETDATRIQFSDERSLQFEVRSQTIMYSGRNAPLVTFHDFAGFCREKGISKIYGEIPESTVPPPFEPPNESQAQTQVLGQRIVEVIDSTSDSFVTLDPNYNFTFLNSSAEDLLGRPRKHLLGRNIWEEFPETIGSKFHSEYVRAHEKMEKTHFVEYSKALKKMLSVTAYPTSEGLALFCRDVSKQFTQNEQIGLLETAVSHLNDMVSIYKIDNGGTSKDAQIVFANESFSRHTGYSLDEIIGQSPRILDGPETSQNEMNRLDEAIRTPRSIRNELIRYTKEGTPYWVEMELVPIASKSSDFSHWVAVERDVTDRKITEERILVREERFQLLSLATKVVIWDCDLQTDTIWWNDNLFDVFGHKPSAHDERSTWWDENLHPDEKSAVQERIQSFVDGSETIWELQYRFLKADGSFAHVADKGTIIRDVNGKAIRILGSMNDVSDRIRLDEQLRQSQKLEAIGQLTGGVAHDFNNLLAVILGNLELLQLELEMSEKNSPILENLISSGKTAVLRGADLATSMLAYARKSQLDPEETDLNAIVLETEKWIRRTIESNVDIKVRLQPDLWNIRVDPSSLQNAIINLLVNSRDAMEGSGELNISTTNVPSSSESRKGHGNKKPKGDSVLLQVSDNGKGMDQSTLAQIFTPFFTTKPIGEGSGLGLSMVQGFVKQSEGTISVDSSPGNGTHVKIYFEAMECEGIEDAARPAVNLADIASSHPPAIQRILVAEDEPEVMAILKKILENEGYDVTTALNGDLGYMIFEKDTSFDLILTDITMPGELQGDGLAKSCRQLRPDVPVIFLSGYAMKPGSRDDLGQPGDIRLTKPILRDELLNAISNRLANPIEVPGPK